MEGIYMGKKQKVKWQGVSLPVPFINDIKKHIAGKNQYRNVPAFVIDAVREKLAAEKREKIFVEQKNKFNWSDEGKRIEKMDQLINDMNKLKKQNEKILNLFFKKKKDETSNSHGLI